MCREHLYAVKTYKNVEILKNNKNWKIFDKLLNQNLKINVCKLLKKKVQPKFQEICQMFEKSYQIPNKVFKLEQILEQKKLSNLEIQR